MRICVMGAGAVGGYFGARLQNAGHNVLFVTRGRQLTALKKKPLTIVSVNGDFAVRARAASTPPSEPFDLILFCVKTRDISDAADSLRSAVRSKTKILTLQNGLTAADHLEQFYPDQVITGVAFTANSIIKPGKIHHQAAGYITAGIPGKKPGQSLKALKTDLDAAGIPCRLTGAIRMIQWEKLMWNACFNTISSVILDRPVGWLIQDPETRRIGESIMKEVWMTAKAAGYRIPFRKTVNRNFTLLKGLENYATSMQQDIIRKKPTEKDEIVLSVIRKAETHRIKTPVLKTVYALVTSFEHKEGII